MRASAAAAAKQGGFLAAFKDFGEALQVLFAGKVRGACKAGQGLSLSSTSSSETSPGITTTATPRLRIAESHGTVQHMGHLLGLVPSR